ncbi:hypothetical protein [Variovorax boronicumulans]|uniref:hypothetical protein n=1 Tax=Variovorax boronicumulans TaxID=436515 RepID=UPI000AEA1FB0|nr:hypothetical protein [Variovorax boronicumulans]
MLKAIACRGIDARVNGDARIGSLCVDHTSAHGGSDCSVCGCGQRCEGATETDVLHGLGVKKPARGGLGLIGGDTENEEKSMNVF